MFRHTNIKQCCSREKSEVHNLRHHRVSCVEYKYYREADVFLLFYKISDINTLFSAINFWVSELKSHAPTTPIVLISCQSDLRCDMAVIQALAKQGRSPVSSEQARSFSQQIKAISYVETSAKTSTKGPESIFEIATQISIEQVKEPDF